MKRGTRSDAHPLEEETLKLHLVCEEASVGYPKADEDVNASKNKPVLSQFDKAYEQQKPVIVYIYTDDIRKKHEMKRNA